MSSSYSASGQQWGQYEQPRIQLEEEYDFPIIQQGAPASFQFNPATYDPAQFTPLPPSQPTSLHPSRDNSRSSSLTRSPFDPPVSLDSSQLQPNYTPQNFQSFAQYTAFLNSDQPEYNNTPTHNFTAESFSGAGLISVEPPATTSATRAIAAHVAAQQKVKRKRIAKTQNIGGEPEMEEERGTPTKSSGACARCKLLKVKCEFQIGIEACKRCQNSAHECIIPGRKPRKAPPKREYLLTQIREQAAQIQKLMTQLEGQTQPSDAFSALHSPVLSPSSLPPDGASSSAEADVNKAVVEWIAKARGNFAEFDGLLGLGGSEMPRSYPVNEDSGSSSEDEDYDSEDDSDSAAKYEIEVLDAEGGEIVQRGRRNRIRDGSDVSNSGSGKLATLPSEASAFGLMANLSLKQGRRDPDAKSALDIANVDFFRPNRAAPDPTGSRPLGGGPTIPHILRRGLISPQEVEKLFDIYFQAMNISTSALDPVLHTPQKTLFRSPFLFTVVCALASKFYTERPELYPLAMHFAQMAAGTALIGGQKRVDLVQAYLLMATYPVPSRRWDEDRGWIYLGLAIRMATDLNLHLPSTATPVNETHAREMLNRARTWLHCFNLDRSMGSEYGKAPTIRNDDFIATHAEDWWRSSPYNLPHSDIHICGYNADLKVMGAFMGKIFSDPTHPTMLNKNVDFEAIASETDEELKALAEKWWLLLDQTDMTHPHNQYRCGMLRLAFSYGRLVALSFGFQYAFGKNVTTENPFFVRCMAAASDVVKATVNDLGGGPSQRVYLRHGPIGVSIFVTFAASMLIKFLQPKFAAYLTSERRKEVRALVKSVINLLSSPEVSVDDKHGPSLYGRFLKSLLAAPLAKRPRRPTAARNSSSGQGGDSTTSSAASTDSGHSLSPAPTTASLSFDSFAPPLDGSVDPFMPIAASDGDPSVPNFLTPAMNFGDDAMQGLPAVWPEDFSTWMTQLQTELMKPGEPMVYNSY